MAHIHTYKDINSLFCFIVYIGAVPEFDDCPPPLLNGQSRKDTAGAKSFANLPPLSSLFKKIIF